ncbi:MAG: hypothetical protein K2N58_08990 [Treponemataceae bacterium]|nr:hypothetical protein [Treponemataceae bacterium]
MEKIKSMIVWGDSILKGVISNGDSKDFEITPNDSLSLVGNKLGIQIANKSIYGATIQKLRRTQQKNFRVGIAAEFGIVESGSNDCDFEWSEVCKNPNAPRVQKCPLEEFCKILGEMILDSRQKKITPIVITPPPLVTKWWFKNICLGLDEKIILDFLGGDTEKLFQSQDLYSEAAKNVAQKLNAQIIDVRAKFLAQGDFEKLMCLDGIHPNEKGHEFMARIFEREFPRLNKEF